MPPFLTLFTRHMASRPQLYANLLASIAAQTDQDFEHVVTVDETGQGFAWANAQFVEHMADCHGDYMQQLDDDDVFATPEAVALLHAAALATDPDIIVFRVHHCQLGILPDASVWGKQFIYSHIGSGDMIVKRAIWNRHLSAYQSGVYESDWHFMRELGAHGYRVQWLDKLLIRCQRISHGKGE